MNKRHLITKHPIDQPESRLGKPGALSSSRSPHPSIGGSSLEWQVGVGDTGATKGDPDMAQHVPYVRDSNHSLWRGSSSTLRQRHRCELLRECILIPYSDVVLPHEHPAGRRSGGYEHVDKEKKRRGNKLNVSCVFVQSATANIHEAQPKQTLALATKHA